MGMRESLQAGYNNAITAKLLGCDIQKVESILGVGDIRDHYNSGIADARVVAVPANFDRGMVNIARTIGGKCGDALTDAMRTGEPMSKSPQTTRLHKLNLMVKCDGVAMYRYDKEHIMEWLKK